MSNEAQLLEKLESCVKRVGEEWAEKSDARFIGEFSLQAELVHLLWTDRELWFRTPLEEAGPSVELPLVYTEWYAIENKRFDLALLPQSTIEKWRKNIRYIDRYHEEAAKLPVLSAVEVKCRDRPWIKKSIGLPWCEKIEEDFDKLIMNMTNGRVKHGYLLIFYNARMYPPNWSRIEAHCEQRFVRLNLKDVKDKDLNIYFASCEEPSIPARWLRFKDGELRFEISPSAAQISGRESVWCLR